MKVRSPKMEAQIDPRAQLGVQMRIPSALEVQFEEPIGVQVHLKDT